MPPVPPIMNNNSSNINNNNTKRKVSPAGSPSLLELHHKALHRFVEIGCAITYGCYYPRSTTATTDEASSVADSLSPLSTPTPSGSPTMPPSGGSTFSPELQQRSDTMREVSQCTLCSAGELSAAAAAAMRHVSVSVGGSGGGSGSRLSGSRINPPATTYSSHNAKSAALAPSSNTNSSTTNNNNEAVAARSRRLHAKLVIAYHSRLQGMHEWVETFSASDQPALRAILPFITEDYMEYCARLGARSGNMGYRQYVTLADRCSGATRGLGSSQKRSARRGNNNNNNNNNNKSTVMKVKSPTLSVENSMISVESNGGDPIIIGGGETDALSAPISFCNVPSLASITEVGEEELIQLLQVPRYIAGMRPAGRGGSNHIHTTTTHMGEDTVSTFWGSPRLFRYQAANLLNSNNNSNNNNSMVQKWISKRDASRVGELCACDVYLVLSDNELTVWGCNTRRNVPPPTPKQQQQKQQQHIISEDDITSATETTTNSLMDGTYSTSGGDCNTDNSNNSINNIGEMFFIAHSLEDYVRLGAAFGWVYGWQLCYASSGPSLLSLPWLKLFNPSALAAANQLHVV